MMKLMKHYYLERNEPCFICRMESTEKCEAIIQHFNGKYIKTPPGVPGEDLLSKFSYQVAL